MIKREFKKNPIFLHFFFSIVGFLTLHDGLPNNLGKWELGECVVRYFLSNCRIVISDLLFLVTDFQRITTWDVCGVFIVNSLLNILFSILFEKKCIIFYFISSALLLNTHLLRVNNFSKAFNFLIWVMYFIHDVGQRSMFLLLRILSVFHALFSFSDGNNIFS